jgi:hypothetical protein
MPEPIKESWKVKLLDPALNATEETAQWARQHIAAAR